MKNKDFDVVIVGGSFAGLSAAMALGRAIRDVLIIDAGKPCNRQTPHSHNFLTQDGSTPDEISALAKSQVLAYPTVQFESDTVIDVTGMNNDFIVKTAEGKIYTTRKILFSTGVKDILPEIAGFAESWGISVIHCPYCHGYEYKGQNTGILANDDMAIDFVKLIGNWTQKLTLFTNGKAIFDKKIFDKISIPGFQIVEKEVAELIHESGHLKVIVFKDGSVQEIDALYARVPFIQHTDVPVKMGCELTGMGHIKVDEFGKTSISGIYAAGDNTSRMRSVSSAVAAGTAAGAFLNHEMIAE
ncbi:NAD(P)/FAD-dependent oxidoreductase [Dyadobacter subterraneus]|uniref:NAD(P)/FAD-dependent oxidoreductase n=1 Tax=Dyadobacter subterraneus TaxID=2773304 RepID=A0ABR9WH15_9BACT|nr:NAD(P)/FAD-dependent oxidoreductase [Dyadobacter subterraneus]MBE9464206.1 NAD(P)/FAD-dependent oxidoreductase [Dyadobacter subterraneus]